MAQDSYDFFKRGANDAEFGGQGNHQSLSNPLTTGGSYYRDYIPNSKQVKAVLTGSNFQGLDGSQAVSVRATVRVRKNLAGQAWLMAKCGSTSLSQDPSNPVQYEPGYKLGIRAININFINAYFHASSAPNGSSYYGLQSSHGTVGHNASPTLSNIDDRWVYLRMDVCPVIQTSDNSIIGDKILAYRSDDGESWTLFATHEIDATSPGFIPWDDPTYNKYGFMIADSYIDNFEIYLSTGYV